jgi:YjbE family integral membrane protein
MDIATFLTALATIVVIDLVLAGDNAIVIALAARRLPAQLQKRAILWGAVGAIVVRSSMTAAVVWLLQLPGLLALGGSLLVWIAWKLLLPDEADGADHDAGATTFWAAMRTIVVADALMGLDNVLAVAGAAHGSYVLVVLGLLISVPVVVWGSTLVLTWVERYPAIVYAGSAVLCLTAAKMVLAEPLLRELFAASPLVAALPYLTIPLVLWLGFVRNHRQLDSRIHARLVTMAAQRPAGVSSAAAPESSGAAAPTISPTDSPTRNEGDLAMLKVLVPVDGTGNSLVALSHAMAEYQRHHELELHLLNVQPRLARYIARWVPRRNRVDFQAEQAGSALAQAQAMLDAAGIPYHSHWRLGDRADEICRSAVELGVHHIVMGTARKNSLTRMLEDSTTNAVLEKTSVPVEVVTGDAVSRLERWGLPAGLGLGLGGLVWLALD